MTDKETEITTPAALVAWAGYYRPEMELNEKEAEMLLGYMEGHGYALTVKAGEMFRKNTEDEREETVPYSMDEVVDVICEWNYEFLETERQEMEETEDSVDFSEQKEYYDSLVADSEMLDGLFDRTVYGKKNDGASGEKPESSEEKTVFGIPFTSIDSGQEIVTANGRRIR